MDPSAGINQKYRNRLPNLKTGLACSAFLAQYMTCIEGSVDKSRCQRYVSSYEACMQKKATINAKKGSRNFHLRQALRYVRK